MLDFRRQFCYSYWDSYSAATALNPVLNIRLKDGFEGPLYTFTGKPVKLKMHQNEGSAHVQGSQYRE